MLHINSCTEEEVRGAFTGTSCGFHAGLLGLSSRAILFVGISTTFRSSPQGVIYGSVFINDRVECTEQ
jgi:hypothetical protein